MEWKPVHRIKASTSRLALNLNYLCLKCAVSSAIQAFLWWNSISETHELALLTHKAACKKRPISNSVEDEDQHFRLSFLKHLLCDLCVTMHVCVWVHSYMYTKKHSEKEELLLVHCTALVNFSKTITSFTLALALQTGTFEPVNTERRNLYSGAEYLFWFLDRYWCLWCDCLQVLASWLLFHIWTL